MKTPMSSMSWFAFATAAIALAGAVPAWADQSLIAKVPFAFIVGDVRLPAGVYVVKEASGTPAVLEISSTDGKRAVISMTIPLSYSSEKAKQFELVFDTVGDQHFLAEVDDGNQAREIVLTPRIMEREILAANKNERSATQPIGTGDAPR